MESGQIIQDFTLNVKRAMGSEIEGQKEQALSTCYEVLASCFDDNVRLYSVKIVQNNDFFINFLKKAPNSEIITQILTTKIKGWNISISLIIKDILSIVPTHSGTADVSATDLFPKKAAAIFLWEMFADLRVSEDFEFDECPLKILFESHSLDRIIEQCKIEKRLISEILENYPNEIRSDETIRETITNILIKEEAENIAAIINSKFNLDDK
ncbi:hypothetical protein RF11_10379 [Thelohanellus kitauei]|uniref:Uncharacterized protein n=1 Tax=Thelohanellus kitauei TaxID=669202 RepID=A0A0C2NF70_THEKT|nr:hypothetical protein RF11_10379 [Thelohanellus kitauei]